MFTTALPPTTSAPSGTAGSASFHTITHQMPSLHGKSIPLGGTAIRAKGSIAEVVQMKSSYSSGREGQRGLLSQPMPPRSFWQARLYLFLFSAPVAEKSLSANQSKSAATATAMVMRASTCCLSCQFMEKIHMPAIPATK